MGEGWQPSCCPCSKVVTLHISCLYLFATRQPLQLNTDNHAPFIFSFCSFFWGGGGDCNEYDLQTYIKMNITTYYAGISTCKNHSQLAVQLRPPHGVEDCCCISFLYGDWYALQKVFTTAVFSCGLAEALPKIHHKFLSSLSQHSWCLHSKEHREVALVAYLAILAIFSSN